jgi:hypothetical protein
LTVGRQKITADAESGRLAGRRNEGFLARWSERKALARAAAIEPEPSGPDSVDASELQAPPPDPAEVRKTDADMPPIEALDADSDYAQFLSPEVSEGLRQAALRRLFHLPHFNVTDGLDDYAGDYRDLAPLGTIVTAHMRAQLQRLAQEKAATGTPDTPRNGQTGVPEATAASSPQSDPARNKEPKTGRIADSGGHRRRAAKGRSRG